MIRLCPGTLWPGTCHRTLYPHTTSGEVVRLGNAVAALATAKRRALIQWFISVPRYSRLQITEFRPPSVL